MTLQVQYSALDVVKDFKKIDNLQYSTILQANYFVVSWFTPFLAWGYSTPGFWSVTVTLTFINFKFYSDLPFGVTCFTPFRFGGVMILS